VDAGLIAARIAPGVGGVSGAQTTDPFESNSVLILALTDWLLLAQEATDAAGGGPAGGGTAPAQPDPPGFASMLPALLGIMALFYFLILRPQKAKEQQFRSMVDALKEKDRVVTIGGIHGVVTNVQREAGVVTLRVDESTGAKIRVNASAIAKVVADEESAESTKAT
jgi:preprotein translocase subunit YajC